MGARRSVLMRCVGLVLLGLLPLLLPMLSCEAAGAPGALGFTIAPGSAPSSPPVNVCAPKGCVANDDCGPAGACADGHCSRR